MNRKTARENAFLLLFEREIKVDETAEEIFDKAVNERGLEVDDFVKNVFFGCVENKRVIDDYVEKALVGWSKQRVSFVSKAVLSLATYEIMFIDDIPEKVSINEAIELSKKYGDDAAPSFVNGILNTIATQKGLK